MKSVFHVLAYHIGTWETRVLPCAQLVQRVAP